MPRCLAVTLARSCAPAFPRRPGCVTWSSFVVMAGLVPAIHVLAAKKDEDAHASAGMTRRKGMRVLVTRPEPDAARTAETLRAAGHEVTVDSAACGRAGRLCRAGGRIRGARGHQRQRAPHCRRPSGNREIQIASAVRARRADRNAARLAGFVYIEIAGGDAQALGERLARRLPAGARVLSLAGEIGRATSRRGLRRRRSRSKRSSSTAPRRRNGSRRRRRRNWARAKSTPCCTSRREVPRPSWRRATGRAQSALRSIRHLCLSAAVAAVLFAAGASAEIAPRPEEAALLALLDA